MHVWYWLFVFFLGSSAYAVPLEIIYPKPESDSDTRYNYQWELLRQALAITDGDYLIRQADTVMSEERLVRELASNSRHVTIIRENSSKALDNLLLAIPIPLKKGMLGWRVMLTHQDQQPALRQVETIDDLREYRFGLGQGWADKPILLAAGLKVVEGLRYDGLFQLLMAGNRFELFPRGLGEGVAEYHARKGRYPEMVLEESFVLRYPYVEYFYVNKRNKALAERIELGLNRLIENGTFTAIFDRYFEQSLRLLNLDTRTIIDIKNPFIGQVPYLDQEEYWLPHYLKEKGICDCY